MPPPTQVPERVRNRNRRLFLAIVALFLGSFALAGILRFSGWQPDGLRNRGQLLQPPADLRDVALQRVDGAAYAWNPAERRWRMLVAPPADCDAACDGLAQQLDLVWQLFGKDADRVDILWVGNPPAATRQRREFIAIQPQPQLQAQLQQAATAAAANAPERAPASVPQAQGAAQPAVPVYVVDPNGFVILRYPAGFDPGDLRTDMARLLKLK